MTTALFFIRPTLLLMSIVVLGACSGDEPHKQQLDGQTMGTYYRVTWIESSENKVQQSQPQIQSQIDTRLEAINQMMSTYVDDSQISEFNKSNNTDWFTIDPEFAKVVQQSLAVYDISDGYFDITVGPLVEMYGFGVTERNQPPSDIEIQEIMPFIGSDHIAVRNDPAAIKKDHANVHIDLSAIAKGYAVDQIAQLLNNLGINDFLIDIGGELYAQGKNHHQQFWVIGIETPSLSGSSQVNSRIKIDDFAVATSGDYRNFYEYEGQQYTHTIDPKTGLSALHTLASVSVIDKSTMRADALATAIMSMGPERGYQFALQNKLPVLMIIRQGDDFTDKISPAMAAYIL